MSLFGSIMSDMERDPIFGAHHRAMNRMMGGLFGGASAHPMFGGGGSGLSPFDDVHSHQLMPFGNGAAAGPFGAMNLFGGFPAMNSLMTQHQHQPDSPGLFYSSSSVTSITSAGPDGRPHVYQASATTRSAPGGIKETRKTITDSRSGTKKMEVGRHLGQRAHLQERAENLYTGQREEAEEYIGLGEEEAPHFDREWRQMAQSQSQAQSQHGHYPRHAQQAIAYHPAYNRQGREPSGREHHSSGRERERGREHAHGHAHAHPSSGREHNHHSNSSPLAVGVTIEELPPSDDEEMGIAQGPATAAIAQAPAPIATPPARRPRGSAARGAARKLKRARKY